MQAALWFFARRDLMRAGLTAGLVPPQEGGLQCLVLRSDVAEGLKVKGSWHSFLQAVEGHGWEFAEDSGLAQTNCLIVDAEVIFNTPVLGAIDVHRFIPSLDTGGVRRSSYGDGATFRVYLAPFVTRWFCVRRTQSRF